jgi:hypothetical protein
LYKAILHLQGKHQVPQTIQEWEGIRVPLTTHYYAAATADFCCFFFALGFKAKETAQ